MPIGDHSVNGFTYPNDFRYEKYITQEAIVKDSATFAITDLPPGIEFPGANSTVLEAVLTVETTAPKGVYAARVGSENLAYGPELIIPNSRFVRAPKSTSRWVR